MQTREPALAPPVQSAPFPLAPAVPTTVLPLDDGSVSIVEVDLRPAVDTAPESLRTQVFALRIERTALPAVRPTQRITLLEPETRHVGPLPKAVSEKAMPVPAETRAAAPLPPATLAPDVLRRCLEALYRSSGASSTADLRLVGIYPRVPVGAIRGGLASARTARSTCACAGPALPHPGCWSSAAACRAASSRPARWGAAASRSSRCGAEVGRKWSNRDAQPGP